MTLSFSRLGKMGRLGNQLFQIASVTGIAERAGATSAFPNWQYEQYFEPIPHGQFGTNIVKELYYHYHEPELTGDDDLVGYFQSPKYFGSVTPRFKQSFLDQQRDRLPKGEKIAIHIRRSDYVGHSEYVQLPVTWFIKAILSIPDWQSKQLVFFSDDMGYVKTHFECLPNASFIQGTDVEHLAMGSLCDYHIISNSSFGWWMAYLSEQKHVIYPGEYFRGSYSRNQTKDLWPEGWHSFWPEDMKLDCSDLTFTIPVHLDSPDRKKNLDLSLCHLQTYLKAEYIVGECKSKSFEYISDYATYKHFDYPEFHRTKMLNQMAEMATTPFIANWDCDIFIPPMQVWLVCEMLRAGAQMVYPYDGRFARMDRFPWFKKVEQYIDIGVVSDNTLSGRGVKESVGGAVCWNKESFIEYGMENEHMISYAPEDVERYERAFKLGCKIDKVGGVLYHMDHFKGPDSSNKSPHFAASKALLEKYRAMTADELRKEVDTFSWRHQYSAGYYDRFIESAQRSAREVYKELLRRGHINGIATYSGEPWPSIIDIGCGVGEWALGNPNYIGVDYGIPKKKLLIPVESYIDADLDNPNSGIPVKYKGYDLCLCLEVAEHLKPESADGLIKFLCSLSDLVLFSAAIPNQGGTGHKNEQWQIYWADKFAANGFGAEICYPVKDNPNVCLWYRQNMILYRRGATWKVHNFILPEYYEQIILHRQNQIQELSDRCASLQIRLQ